MREKRSCSQSTIWALSPTAALPPFSFPTYRTEPLAAVEAEHRKHTVVEHAIRDLNGQALAHFPARQFTAAAAWTVIAALAHNLLR